MSGNGAGLPAPKTDEWPKITEWLARSAFLRFKLLLASMFASLEYVVGNESYRGDWCLIYDEAERKTHASYPPPTSAPRRLVHRGLQIFLHRVLLHTFQDLCPAILINYLSTAKYDDPALQDADGHPYCVGTHLLRAIETYSVPTDDQSSMNVKAKFET
jgi:hypothetical protein